MLRSCGDDHVDCGCGCGCNNCNGSNRGCGPLGGLWLQVLLWTWLRGCGWELLAVAVAGTLVVAVGALPVAAAGLWLRLVAVDVALLCGCADLWLCA